MKKTKLNYHFHNPNSTEDTAEFLCKLLIEANAGKVERAMEEAAMKCAEAGRYIIAADEISETAEEETISRAGKAR